MPEENATQQSSLPVLALSSYLIYSTMLTRYTHEAICIFLLRHGDPCSEYCRLLSSNESRNARLGMIKLTR
jgi:hypothetical protein